MVTLGIDWAITKIDIESNQVRRNYGRGHCGGWTGGALGGRVITILRVQCLDIISDFSIRMFSQVSSYD